MTDTVKDTISLRVPAKGEYLSLIRITASSIAAKMGFNIDDIDDIKVSMGEACTSIIENLDPSDENNFDIEYSVLGNDLDIKIKSKGGKSSQNQENDSEKLEDILDEGLGMLIIESLMDEVKVTDTDKDGMEIKMIKTKRDE